MKVLVPFNNQENFYEYKEAGAGEFYIGFYDPDWHKAFGDYADLNRISGYKNANSNTFEDILPIIKKVKKENLTIYVTFNASIYSQDQIDFMTRYMEPLYEAGADGIIVSCSELVEVAQKHNLPAIISTIASVYNTDIVRHYYNMGVKRIILPRDLCVDDIEQIVKTCPDIEYEVFMMRNGCSFSDGNCLGLHRGEKSAICAALIHAQNKLSNDEGGFMDWHDMELNHMLFHNAFHSYTCGMCSIYRFVKMNIMAGKIVGRTDQHQEISADIRLVCENIKIAENCQCEEEYLEKMKFPTNVITMCKMGMNCYYPETRFHVKNSD